MKNKLIVKHITSGLLLRIALSPFAFIWGCFLLFALTFFPLNITVPASFVALIIQPVIWLFRKAGSEVDYMEPLITATNSRTINHILSLTVHFWGAFYITYKYIKDGELITLLD